MTSTTRHVLLLSSSALSISVPCMPSFGAFFVSVLVWNSSDAVAGGQTLVVQAPLEVIPAYWRA